MKRCKHDAAESFRIMCDHGVLPQDGKLTYITMAKFRNRVVRMYDVVNEEEIHNIIASHLVDFEKFVKDIPNYIQYSDSKTMISERDPRLFSLLVNIRYIIGRSEKLQSSLLSSKEERHTLFNA